MNHRKPPRIATWILEHLRPAGCDEALAGDLLEEFRSGRSRGWYWLQIIAALAVEWGQSAWRHRTSLFFAAAWSVVSPSWELINIRSLWQSDFRGHIWRIPWPWSTICVLVLSLVEAMLFIWLGALAYVMFCRLVFGKLHFRRLGIAILWSVVVYALTYACESAIFLLANLQLTSGVDWRTLTLLGVVEDFRIWTMFVRLPYFVGTVGALWFLTSTVKTSADHAA